MSEPEERVIEKCKNCGRLEIEGHDAAYLAEQLRSHATWLLRHHDTITAMLVKDSAAMLERLSNERAIVEKFMERLTDKQTYEWLLESAEKKIDELQDPVERGAADTRRAVVGTLLRWMEERPADYVDDELMLQMCGALQEHIQLRKEGAVEDLRELWDLCFERTKHLLDDDDREILREKGLLE